MVLRSLLLVLPLDGCVLDPPIRLPIHAPGLCIPSNSVVPPASYLAGGGLSIRFLDRSLSSRQSPSFLVLLAILARSGGFANVSVLSALLASGSDLLVLGVDLFLTVLQLSGRGEAARFPVGLDPTVLQVPGRGEAARSHIGLDPTALQMPGRGEASHCWT